MQVTICNRWQFYVNPKHLDVNGSHEPFMKFMGGEHSRIAELAKFTWCWHQLVQYIDKRTDEVDYISTVVDLFGGAGRTAIIINEILQPDEYVIVDVDELQCSHLRSLAYPLDVVRADSYEYIDKLESAPDFLVLDMPTFTMAQWHKDGKLRDFLCKAFSLGARYVEMVDTAFSYLHVNKKLYSTLAGTDISGSSDYIRAVSMLFEEHYDYGITFAAKYRNMGAILFEPMDHVDTDDIEIVAAEDDPTSNTYMVVED